MRRVSSSSGGGGGSSMQKNGVRKSRVAKQSHGHPVRIIEADKREHPSSIKTTICLYFILFMV